MTESEWLECAEPQKMLEFLHGKASERKLRLFSSCCAKCSLSHLPVSQAIDTMQSFVDLRLRKRLNYLWDLWDFPEEGETALYRFFLPNQFTGEDAATIANSIVAEDATGSAEQDAMRQAQCVLLLDIFGNPFRPVSIVSQWLTPTVLALAQAAYDNRWVPDGTLDNARLAVLADALEDAGLDDCGGLINIDILPHLRGTGEHVEGCWVIDAILGKD